MDHHKDRCKSIIPVQQRAQGKNIVAFFLLTSVETQSFVYYPYGLNTLIQLVWRINTLKNRCWAIVPDNDSLGRVSESSLKAMSMELPLQNNFSHNVLWGEQLTALILYQTNPKKESELHIYKNLLLRWTFSGTSQGRKQWRSLVTSSLYPWCPAADS